MSNQTFKVTWVNLRGKQQVSTIRDAYDADDAEYQARARANRPRYTWYQVVSVEAIPSKAQKPSKRDIPQARPSLSDLLGY